MGVGLSEYRVAIGIFAGIAEKSSLRRKRKQKNTKISKLQTIAGEKKLKTTNSARSDKNAGSLDRWRRRENSHVGKRSKSLNNQRECRNRVKTLQLSRAGSKSIVRGRKKESVERSNFKTSCITCRTDMFDGKFKRGRATTRNEKPCNHIEKGLLAKGSLTEKSKIRFFICLAVSKYLALERALIAIIQMLLIMSGIETNPGPMTENNAPCCNASQHFNRVKNSIKKNKNNFQSKIVPGSLSKKVIEVEETGGNVSLKSIEDLKAKFLQEYPTDRLVSIPVVKLQNYKSVPVFLTEDDIRENIKMEEEELLEERIPNMRAKRQEVISCLKKLKFNPSTYVNIEEVARNLNNLLFEDTFTGKKDCPCQDCQIKSCTLNEARKCNVNKGLLTPQRKAKRDFKTKIEDVLSTLNDKTPEENVPRIDELVIEELRNGIYSHLQKEIQGILANMVGRNTENYLTGILEDLLQDGKGLLLNGFNVRENLKLFFHAFNIKLKEYGNKGGQGKKGKELKEIEHDVLYLSPHEDTVNVLFVQAKSQLNVPWTQAKKVENARRIVEKACSQGVADIDTFTELVSHFLTDDQFKMISMKFNITMSDLSNIPETEICYDCRKAFVFEEDRGKEDKYSPEELQTLFGVQIGQSLEKGTESHEADEIFTLLSTIYAGGGSLVKLKSSKEKYKEENLFLKEADQKMRSLMQAESPTTKPPPNSKSALDSKWVSRNKNIKLSPNQSNLYNSKIGLKGGYCMIGGHGTGKSMMIQLEMSRSALLHKSNGTKAKIFVVVWEMKAKELLESYKSFAQNIDHSEDVKLEFLNKEALCQKTQVDFEGRHTTAIINDVIKNLSAMNDSAVYLFIDEVEVENPGVTDPINLMGKTPICLGGEIFPWSMLEPLGVHLVVAVTTDSQELAPLMDFEEVDKQRLRSALEAVPPAKIPTVVLWRVFRCSNAIQNIVEHLQLECSKKEKDFGFAVNPKVQIRGHDVRGDLVEWIPCNETDHMICPQQCRECFLLMVNEALTERLETLEAEGGVDLSEVKVIVSNFSRKRTPEDNRIKEFFTRNHPSVDVKLNFEMEGLEAPTVILIRNGGYLGSAISLGVSRATTKLIMISTDDNGIMERALDQKKVRKIDTVQDRRSLYDHVKIPEGSQKERWSYIGSNLHTLQISIPNYLHSALKDFFNDQTRMFLAEDLDRESKDSIQSLCECLCNTMNEPLLHDPNLDTVDLCYKAIPRYSSIINKRQSKVDARVEKRKLVLEAEKKAKRLEESAANSAADKGKEAETQKDVVERKKLLRRQEELERKKEKYKQEREEQALLREQLEKEFPEKNEKFLTGDNQPININDEHEFAHLYLSEVYSTYPGCNILELKMDALLTILSQASCFPEDLREQASEVKKVRNKWLCSSSDYWTTDNTEEAMTELAKLAQMIPGAQQALKKREEKFPSIVFHSNIQRYRLSIKDQHHEKIRFKIKKLESVQGREIYVERKYKSTKTEETETETEETETEETTSDVRDLLLENKVVLLKGEAGSGKSSVTTKLIQRWAEGEEAEDQACMLFLSAGSEGKVSLQRILWDGHGGSVNWSEEHFHEAYLCLQHLAIEGKLTILLDGLDEIGTMGSKDVLDANQSSLNPHMEVELKTAFAGILTQKIFPGARVLATGRIVNVINDQILAKKGLLYDLVPFNELDREAMVEKMEDSYSEKTRVLQELQRISTKSNEVFFKSPLMLKNIIQLVIERKVNVDNLECPSEVYLMLAMKNLDFQTGKNTSFLELDPPEDQDYLKMCMMICQQKIQEPGKEGSINTIEGIQRNVKGLGPCFEKKVFDERLQIPIVFIQKFGFFDIRRGQNKLFLDIVHLSYMEFCCAASLCREKVIVDEELSKIKDLDRFEAVTSYMAGLFSNNPSVEFLLHVRHIAENFLLMLGNEQREKCIQDVFRAIVKRSDLRDSKGVIIEILMRGEGEYRLRGVRHTKLLVQAMEASADFIRPVATIRDICILDSQDKEAIKIGIQLMHKCLVGQFELQSLYIRDMRLLKDKTTQLTIRCLDADNGETESTLLLHCLRSLGVQEIKIGKVDCKRDFSMRSLMKLLSIPTLQKWTIDQFEIGRVINPWQYLTKTVGQGSINSCSLGGSGWWDDIYVQQWMSNSKMEEILVHISLLHFKGVVHCENIDEVKILCTVLDFAQQWRLSELKMPGHTESVGWTELRKVSDNGEVDTYSMHGSGLGRPMIDCRKLETDSLSGSDKVNDNYPKKMCCQLL